MAFGDHLYYYMAGGTYSHHGIDCGDGTVIHYELTPWMKLTGKLIRNQRAAVARTTMEEFAAGNEVRVRPYNLDAADEPEVAVSRAMSRLGEDAYSVFGNNCEHFVVWCKTGEAMSSQVDAHFKATKTVVKGAPIGVALLRAARFAPAPYRGLATVGAIGIGGLVYLATYINHRLHHVKVGLS